MASGLGGWCVRPGSRSLLKRGARIQPAWPAGLRALQPRHATPLLEPPGHAQGVAMEDVMRVLRKRFGTSGIEEKASRPPKH
jgi:hypothetical protein